MGPRSIVILKELMERDMTIAATLLSIQVGMPRTLGVVGATDPMEKRWTSAIFKEPATGPIRVGDLGLAGDGQADRQHHGGPDKAINVYPSEHYAYWREELPTCDMVAGAFGENFTTVSSNPRSASATRLPLATCWFNCLSPGNPASNWLADGESETSFRGFAIMAVRVGIFVCFELGRWRPGCRFC